jgi:tetratricopeptide (TPR) repeat protein
MVHRGLGEHEEAKRMALRSIQITEKAIAADHPIAAHALVNLAKTHEDLGELDEARAAYARALEIYEGRLGTDHPDVGWALVGLAQIELARNRPHDALPLAARAVEVRERGAARPSLLARARFVLAQAMWEAGEDAAEAVRLADRARDGFREAESDAVAEVEAWLAKHDPVRR